MVGQAVIDTVGTPTFIALGTNNLIVGTNGAGDMIFLVNGAEKARLVSATGGFQTSGGFRYPAALTETVGAAGSVQGDGPLTAGKFIHLVTGFDETKVVTLPAAAAANIGEVHFILNNTTNKFAKVFPAAGGTINSLSANAAYTQGVTGNGGRVLMAVVTAANTWLAA